MSELSERRFRPVRPEEVERICDLAVEAWRPIYRSYRHMLGDVMFDAAVYYQKFSRKPQLELPDNFVLATIHRAENTDNLDRLKAIFEGLDKIGKTHPIILPLHPRTRKTIKNENLDINDSIIRIIDPVSYLEIICLLEKCSLVMTDSGGLQKEAFFFKKPCVTLRNETEWVELVDNGVNVLAGADSERIYGLCKEALTKEYDFELDLYGKGDAGERIVRILRDTA